MLAHAGASASRDELASMSLGRRDELLLRLRQTNFGDALHLLATCPSCNQRIELDLSCSRLIDAAATERDSDELTIESEGYGVRLRLPNSYDVAAIARFADVDSAYELLLSRCVVAAHHYAQSVPAADLPEFVRTVIADALATADPGAEFLLDLACPQCSHAWEAFLEIGSVLSTEVATTSRRLLLEVHQLARAYGWREPDVLGLSPARRAAYLEMAGQ
jgi:hypothetical protein